MRRIDHSPPQIKHGPTSMVPQELQEHVVMGKCCLNIHRSGIHVRLCRVKSAWPRAVYQASHRKLSSGVMACRARVVQQLKQLRVRSILGSSHAVRNRVSSLPGWCPACQKGRGRVYDRCG